MFWYPRAMLTSRSELQALFFGGDASFLKRRVLFSPSHVCYVSGLPQALFLCEKRHAFLKKCVFLLNAYIFCQYLSMYLPTVRYCGLYGTAYLPTRTVHLLFCTYPYRTRTVPYTFWWSVRFLARRSRRGRWTSSSMFRGIVIKLSCYDCWYFLINDSYILI